MAKKYISLGQLSIASELVDFVNNELLPGTGVTKENFWSGLDKCAHELAPQNKKLLEFRENLQKKIDTWHRDKKREKIDIVGDINSADYLTNNYRDWNGKFKPTKFLIPKDFKILYEIKVDNVAINTIYKKSKEILN